jgi:hypothetical protein
MVYSETTPATVGAASNAISLTSNATVTVPEGAGSVVFTWLVAGGGSGGAGTEGGYGGGGGGGGGGGYYHGYALNVSPGDNVAVVIGNAGAQNGAVNASGDNTSANDGKPGGDSVVYINGTEVLRVTGGGGGIHQTNAGGHVDPPAAGGAGGSPNGQAGANGTVGASDSASSIGGVGGAGPLAGSAGGAGGDTTGGNTFTGGSAGKAGTGYGSGGGGGGCDDRSGQNNWAGGAGVGGFAEFVFMPKQSQSGPTANGTLYQANLVDSGFVKFMTDPDTSTDLTLFKNADPLFGTISSISAPSEALAQASPRLTLVLNPPSPKGLEFVTDPAQQGADVRVWWGIIDPITGQVVFQPQECFKGFVDVPTINGDMNICTVSLQVGSAWELLFTNSEGQRLNSGWHENVWPGETGLSQNIEATSPLTWGAAAPTPAYRQYAVPATLGDRLAGIGGAGLSTGRSIYGN